MSDQAAHQQYGVKEHQAAAAALPTDPEERAHTANEYRITGVELFAMYRQLMGPFPSPPARAILGLSLVKGFADKSVLAGDPPHTTKKILRAMEQALRYTADTTVLNAQDMFDHTLLVATIVRKMREY